MNKETLKSIFFQALNKIRDFSRFIYAGVRKSYQYSQDKLNEIPNWAIREKAHSPVIRYGIVIILAIIVLILKKIIDPLFIVQPPFLFFYGLIVISAWYGGTRPGFFAALLSSILSYEFYLKFLNPQHSSANVLAAFFFLCEGILIVGISHSMHRALQIYEEKKRFSQYYASIAQHISDAVISTDTNLIIQSWNEGAESLYGWKRGEIIGKHYTVAVPAVFHPNLRKNLEELETGAGHWKGECIHQRRNGSRVPILSSMSYLYNEEKQPIGIVFVNRDITDRKKLEQGKDDFIALASHELKTPLTSVKLYTGILKQRFEKKQDTDSLQYLSKIDTQISKLLELVNHLLDVSKTQAGKIQFHFEELNIDNFIRNVVHEIRQITTSHKILIEGQTDKIVALDKDRLRQVIVNLLNNAVKYSAGAEKVVVKLSKQAQHIRVEIQDFGIGIPREKQDKIFDRFYQVTDSKGYTYAGMGLGLYIARDIIEKHNGKLWVESEEGKGSQFIFTLPTISKHNHGQKKEHSARR